MSNKIKFLAAGLWIILLFIAISLQGLVSNVQHTSNELRSAEVNKLLMLSKANELRHSSDDLTLFARNYVVTRNLEYKNNYFTVLAIREGKVPRPINYEHIYWNLQEPLRQKRHPPGKRISLSESMKDLPYSKSELQKLEESEHQSNDLVNLELRAFHLVEGPSLEQRNAIDLLFSKNYEISKEKIMLPLDEFMSELDERLKKESFVIESRLETLFAKLHLFIFISGLLFAALLIIFFYYTNKSYKTINQLALTDSLTKINNRRAFLTSAEELIKLAKRDHESLCLIIMDIDCFKSINDTYGHPVGDAVLKHFVDNVKTYLRDSDLFCRFGGEEFAVLLPRTNLKQAWIVAEKIRTIIDRTPYISKEVVVPYTVSIGICEFVNGDSLEELLRYADNALYKSKQMGKNNVNIFDRNLNIFKNQKDIELQAKS